MRLCFCTKLYHDITNMTVLVLWLYLQQRLYGTAAASHHRWRIDAFVFLLIYSWQGSCGYLERPHFFSHKDEPNTSSTNTVPSYRLIQEPTRGLGVPLRPSASLYHLQCSVWRNWPSVKKASSIFCGLYHLLIISYKNNDLPTRTLMP